MSNPSKIPSLVNNLIEIVKSLSVMTACHAADSVLLQNLGVGSKQTLHKVLKQAQADGLVQIVSKKYIANKKIRTSRFIYLVSEASLHDGAQMFATLVRDIGRTVENSAENRLRFCGQLRCTPDQLKTWSDYAQSQGWTTLKGSKYVNPPAAGFKRVDLPARAFIHGKEVGKLEKIEVAPAMFARELPASVKVLNWMKGREVETLTMPYSKIAAAVGLPVKTVTSAVQKLVVEGKLLTKKVGKLNVITIVGAVDPVRVQAARTESRNDVQAPAHVEVVPALFVAHKVSAEAAEAVAWKMMEAVELLPERPHGVGVKGLAERLIWTVEARETDFATAVQMVANEVGIHYSL